MAPAAEHLKLQDTEQSEEILSPLSLSRGIRYNSLVSRLAFIPGLGGCCCLNLFSRSIGSRVVVLLLFFWA